MFKSIKLMIKSMYLCNKLISVLFAVSLAIIIAAAIYNQADSDASDYNMLAYDKSLLTYVVIPPDGGFDVNVLSSAVERLKSNDEIDDVIINLPFDPNLSNPKDQSSDSCPCYNTKLGYYTYDVACYPLKDNEIFLNTDNFYHVQNKIDLSPDDVANKNLFLWCSNVAEWNMKDPAISFYGRDFIIAGNIDVTESIVSVTNFKSVCDNADKVGSVFVRYKYISNQTDSIIKMQYLIDTFDCNTIISPSERNIQYEEHLNGKKIMNIIMTLLSLISLSFLYAYILESSEKISGIFLLCGCKRYQFLTIAFLSVAIITCCLFLLIIITYNLILKRMIVSFQPEMRYSLNLGCYIQSVMLVLFGIALTFIPASYSFYKKKYHDFKI